MARVFSNKRRFDMASNLPPGVIDGDISKEWAEGPYWEGHQSRCDGHGLRHCPNSDTIGIFAHNSWVAGWEDADQEIRDDGKEDEMPIRE
jgi:hypothetical protein